MSPSLHSFLSGYRLPSDQEPSLKFELPNAPGGYYGPVRRSLVAWIGLENLRKYQGDDEVRPLPVLIDTGFDGFIYTHYAHLEAVGVDTYVSVRDTSGKPLKVDRVSRSLDKDAREERMFFKLWGYHGASSPNGDPPDDKPVLLSEKLPAIVFFSNEPNDRRHPPLLGMGLIELLGGRLFLDYITRQCEFSVFNFPVKGPR